MRIVVSGTHASGKSTLISDFATVHPEFVVLPDPFESLDEAWDRPGAAMFSAQLRLVADRLQSDDVPPHLIAERGPLDFLAYLLAYEELSGTALPPDQLRHAATITAGALDHIDLLVVLPLDGSSPIEVAEEEDPELREGMNDHLLDLLDDTELLGSHLEIVELVGDRDARLSTLTRVVAGKLGSD